MGTTVQGVDPEDDLSSNGYPSLLSSVGSSHGHGHFPPHLAQSSSAVAYPAYPQQQQHQAGSSVASLSAALSRPLTPQEADRLAYLDRLKFFLATAPSRWDVEGEGEDTSGALSFFSVSLFSRHRPSDGVRDFVSLLSLPFVYLGHFGPIFGAPFAPSLFLLLRCAYFASVPQSFLSSQVF